MVILEKNSKLLKRKDRFTEDNRKSITACLSCGVFCRIITTSSLLRSLLWYLRGTVYSFIYCMIRIMLFHHNVSQRSYNSLKTAQGRPFITMGVGPCAIAGSWLVRSSNCVAQVVFLMLVNLRVTRRSGFEPWPRTLCFVLGQDTLLPQCLSNFMLRKLRKASAWWATCMGVRRRDYDG